jgi:hypothetical protein
MVRAGRTMRLCEREEINEMRRDSLLSGGPISPAMSAVRSFHEGHFHALHDKFSRRRFLEGAAGATAVGAAIGAGLISPGSAHAEGAAIARVVPIPTTTEFFPGVQSHVQAPPFLEGPDSDPSTVYNFKGATGLAYISGTVERRNRRTGHTRSLPFVFNDMRFMKGKFRDRDGQLRRATFAFV